MLLLSVSLEAGISVVVVASSSSPLAATPNATIAAPPARTAGRGTSLGEGAVEVSEGDGAGVVFFGFEGDGAISEFMSIPAAGSAAFVSFLTTGAGACVLLAAVDTTSGVFDLLTIRRHYSSLVRRL